MANPETPTQTLQRLTEAVQKETQIFLEADEAAREARVEFDRKQTRRMNAETAKKKAIEELTKFLNSL